ncbi:hypothetical protein BV22DRAFT_907519 [Leucogyrophana mollusca]|uniref:Uncharacterized protein n=1 Tax=Leucogyrophana mollusca TaxID=85980 RepID=A0ACB8AZS7_9AGAM|nr:hypothetical protein BV22DRAFT_907519 [Leucogyrophana mollusca]
MVQLNTSSCLALVLVLYFITFALFTIFCLHLRSARILNEVKLKVVRDIRPAKWSSSITTSLRLLRTRSVTRLDAV